MQQPRPNRRFSQRYPGETAAVTQQKGCSFRILKPNDDEDVAMISLALTANSNGHKSRGIWIVDSTATSHMCNDKQIFSNLGKENHRMRIRENSQMASYGTGTVQMAGKTDGIERKIYLKEVMFVPDLMYNLFSVAECRANGFKTFFDE